MQSSNNPNLSTEISPFPEQYHIWKENFIIISGNSPSCRHASRGRAYAKIFLSILEQYNPETLEFFWDDEKNNLFSGDKKDPYGPKSFTGLLTTYLDKLSMEYCREEAQQKGKDSKAYKTFIQKFEKYINGLKELKSLLYIVPQTLKNHDTNSLNFLSKLYLINKDVFFYLLQHLVPSVPLKTIKSLFEKGQSEINQLESFQLIDNPIFTEQQGTYIKIKPNPILENVMNQNFVWLNSLLTKNLKLLESKQIWFSVVQDPVTNKTMPKFSFNKGMNTKGIVLIKQGEDDYIACLNLLTNNKIITAQNDRDQYLKDELTDLNKQLKLIENEIKKEIKKEKEKEKEIKKLKLINKAIVKQKIDACSKEILAKINEYQVLRTKEIHSVFYVSEYKIALWNSKCVILKIANDVLLGKKDPEQLKNAEQCPLWNIGKETLYLVNKVKELKGLSDKRNILTAQQGPKK
jgi:hypothetical protein